MSRDTDTAEKLLNGDYYFNVVLKYGSSVNGVDVSRLENTPYKASITVRLIQLSQFAESGTKTDILGSSDCNLTLGDSLTYLYLRENLFLDNFRMSDDENFTRFQKGNMVTYLQNKVDDLILAWDSSVADLSVSSVPAEKQIGTEYYSGKNSRRCVTLRQRLIIYQRQNQDIPKCMHLQQAISMIRRILLVRAMTK